MILKATSILRIYKEDMGLIMNILELNDKKAKTLSTNKG